MKKILNLLLILFFGFTLLNIFVIEENNINNSEQVVLNDQKNSEIKNDYYEIKKKPAQEVELIKFEANYDSGGVTDTTILFKYEINIPNNPEYEETILEKVELVDVKTGEVVTSKETNEGVGEIEAENLEPNTEYKFKLRTTSNVGVVDDNKSITVYTQKSWAEQIDPSDIKLTVDQPIKGENSVSINWDIELPSHPGHLITVIYDIRLFDENEGEIIDDIKYTDRTSATGTVTVDNLEFNNTYSFYLAVETNAEVGYVFSEVISVTLLKGPAQEVELIEFAVSGEDGSITDTIAIFEYEINVPNNPNYDETILEKVELIDMSSNAVVDSDISNVDGFDGELMVSDLKPNTEYKFKLRTTSNVGEVDWLDKFITINTEIGNAKQIESSDINLTVNEPSIGEHEATIDWDIELPLDNPDYHQTIIEDIKLVDLNGDEIVNNVSYSDKNLATGTVTVCDLIFNETYEYKLAVKTNASSEYILSSDIKISVPDHLVITNVEDFKLIDLTLTFDAQIDGNFNTLRIKYKDDELNVDSQVMESSKTTLRNVKYSIELEPESEYDLNDFEISADGTNWKSITLDELISDSLFDDEGYDVVDDGMILFDNNDTNYKLAERDGRIILVNMSSGDIDKPLIITGSSSLKWWWILIILLILLLVISLIILLLNRLTGRKTRFYIHHHHEDDINENNKINKKHN